MDVKTALDKLKKLVIEEKKQLDYLIKGAELLAEMLAAEQSGQQAAEVKHSQPSVAPGQETSPDRILYSAP